MSNNPVLKMVHDVSIAIGRGYGKVTPREERVLGVLLNYIAALVLVDGEKEADFFKVTAENLAAELCYRKEKRYLWSKLGEVKPIGMMSLLEGVRVASSTYNAMIQRDVFNDLEAIIPELLQFGSSNKKSEEKRIY